MGPRPGVSRRRQPTRASARRGFALAAALSVLTAACTGDSGQSRSSPPAPRILEILFFGALSGPGQQTAMPGFRGAQLAFDQFNAAHHNLGVALVGEDTEGSVLRALTLADQIATERLALGIIGPTSSEAVEAIGNRLETAGIPFVTPSASADSISTHRWKHWFRAVASDGSQAEAAARYIRISLHPACTLVSADDSAYGSAMANGAQAALGSQGALVQRVGDASGRKGILRLTREIRTSGCTVLFYGGSGRAAGLVRRQMGRTGMGGIHMVTGGGEDGSDPQAFLAAAGKAGDGTVTAFGFDDLTASTDPAARRFAQAYRGRYGHDPEPGAAEGWDIAQMYIAGILPGELTRQAMSQFLHGLSGFNGLTKSYSFQPSGDLTPDSAVTYLYTEEGGAWSPLVSVPGSST